MEPGNRLKGKEKGGKWEREQRKQRKLIRGWSQHAII